MKNTKIVYALLLGMLVLAMVIVAYQRTVNPTHAVTLDAEGVARQLRGMNDLMTVHYVVQRVVAPHVEPIFLVQGTVSAAVDLKKVQASDVRMDGASVEIRLPDPGITDTSIDESQTQVWDSGMKMWSRRQSFDTLDDEGIRRDAIGWIDRQAEQAGIYKEAARSARQAIQRILLASGMEKVTFSEPVKAK